MGVWGSCLKKFSISVCLLVHSDPFLEIFLLFQFFCIRYKGFACKATIELYENRENEHCYINDLGPVVQN